MTEKSISDKPFLIDFSDLYRFSNIAARYDGTFDTNGDFEFTRAPDGTECMRLVYSPTDASMNDYRFLFSLKDPAAFSDAYRYVRVTYMTDDTRAATLSLRNNCERHTALLVKNTAPYAGKWHRSEAVYIAESSFLRRFSNGKYNGVQFSCKYEGAKIYIKELAFFESREAAYRYYGESVPEAVTLGETDRRTLTVNGNDISKYRAVVADGLPDSVMLGLKKVLERIERLTGVAVPTVSDREPESEYEILVGRSSRPLSGYGLCGDSFRSCAVSVKGKTAVIPAENGFGIRSALELFYGVYLYPENVNVPKRIEIGEGSDYRWLSDLMAKKPERALPENSQSPEVLFESFDNDRGYFTDEAYGKDGWRYSDGCFKIGRASESRSYVHVFETNADVGAVLMFGQAGGRGEMGLMLRCVSEDGYLKAGYDFENGGWFIDSREGSDFQKERIAFKAREITPNRRYTVNFKADGKCASLAVDGETVLTVSELSHISAGRIGIFAADAEVTADDFRAVLLSGEGKIIKNIAHTRLPMSGVGNGASFFELASGEVHAHIPMYSVGFRSCDGGKSWCRTDVAIGEKGKYANILRLSDGSFIGVFADESGGKRRIVSRISEDEGRTWKDRAVICGGYYKDTAAVACNMNDKLTEMSRTGRVFYAQNYQTKAGTTVDGRHVFCEVYYTDDKGESWQKSLTDSWQIEGNEGETRFGECKILECADGTLRMYCSWSDHGCIVYSESHDNGETWERLQRMEDFRTPRSSMQFCRDIYGETDTTYYMIWINNEMGENTTMPRTRLSLARTFDGKAWERLGDIWRWDSAYLHYASKSDLNQIVNPTIAVCKDSIIVGSGISEKLTPERFTYHGFQQQHIWAIKRENIK